MLATAAVFATVAAGCSSAPPRQAAAPAQRAAVVPSAATTPAPAQSAVGSPAITHAPTPVTTATAHATRVSARTNGLLVLAGGVVLPNRARTPGATNPAVTQATIRSTICRTGYTRTIRPSSSYTTGLKRQQLASGYAYRGDLSTGDYEEDHLISLELGGAPSDPRNLWPEPYTAAEGARVKDLVENRLHDLVCSGALSLATAQHAIAGNWWTAYQRYGGEGAPTIWVGSYGGGSTSTSTTSSSAGAPSGATAQCNDGSYSFSQHRSGTCSHHGGVARWINPPPS